MSHTCRGHLQGPFVITCECGTVIEMNEFSVALDRFPSDIRIYGDDELVRRKCWDARTHENPVGKDRIAELEAERDKARQARWDDLDQTEVKCQRYQTALTEIVKLWDALQLSQRHGPETRMMNIAKNALFED